MSKKFTDYDMRKFVINDNKDAYAFFDAVVKGMGQVETLMKKMHMSNTAKDGVIRSYQRKESGLFEAKRQAEASAPSITTATGEKIPVVDTQKESIIQQLRAVADNALDGPETSPEQLQGPSEEKDESTPISAPEGASEQLTDGHTGTDETQDEDKAVETKVESNTYRGYEKKKFKNGQSRYFMDGTMVAAADVPEKIKEVLDSRE